MKEDAAKRIVEEKSINSDIINLSDLIADKILKQAPLKQTQISKINIYFGYKRFKQKLYNAYLFYNFQKNKEYDFKNESKSFEINLSKLAVFDRLMNEAKSKYGKIAYGMEKFYLAE